MSPRTLEEWEKPLKELEEGIVKLRDLMAKEPDQKKRSEGEAKIADLERRRDNYIEATYSQLGPWVKVLVARGATRPYFSDYVQAGFPDFVELQGDRRFGSDHAIIGGPASFRGRSVMVLGHQKGRTIQERQKRNFGYSRPEGYRKASRLFEMAERFHLPVVTLIDTPGADAGVEAEKRGISEAIATSMMDMFALTVPIVSVIIGEGGSGGAIGIAAANRVLMLENSIYSVIAPEGCAAILWRKPEMGPQAAAALKLTADSALGFGLIEEIIPEPLGGAHRDPPQAISSVLDAIERQLKDLEKLDPQALKKDRYDRFRKLGVSGSI